MSKYPDIQVEEPANLKFLRRLVTILTATMIIGLLVIIVLFVVKMPGNDLSQESFPESIMLPYGKIPVAFTQTARWYAVVTSDDTILIFDRKIGNLHQEIKIKTTNMDIF